MNANHEIYRSEIVSAEDAARLDGFVTALKETGSLPRTATIEDAVTYIEKRRAETMGAFGKPTKP